MKIAIISHTEHYINDNGNIVGWGPTIKEINHLLNICDTIYHIAPLHKTKAPGSALEYDSSKVKYIPLKPSGGKGLQKFSILYTAPYNLIQIFSILKKVDKIQFRAPTGMGIYVLPFLRLLPSKKYWVKYAGNWKDRHMPLGNKLQKIWLQKFCSIQTKITINGKWNGERNNVIPFENPCLSQEDRRMGEFIVTNKVVAKKNQFCFVGALNEHKGVPIIIDALSEFNSDQIIFHFIGDSDQKEKYISKTNNLNVKTIFHGFLKKDAIIDIYKDCNFIVLPSKSEGFPKVIGEAMNFGCIPIVSNVSCIDQYVKSNENGYLLQPNTVEELKKVIKTAIEMQESDYKKMILKNYKLSEKFTYEYYNLKIKTEIFT